MSSIVRTKKRPGIAKRLESEAGRSATGRAMTIVVHLDALGIELESIAVDKDGDITVITREPIPEGQLDHLDLESAP